MAHPVAVGPVGDGRLVQSGGADQVGLGPIQDRLSDRTGQYQVGVTPGLPRWRRLETSAQRSRRVQCFGQRREPGPVGRPAQPYQHPRPVHVDRRQRAEESAEYFGVNVEHLAGEPGRQPARHPGQRRQRHARARQRPRGAVLAGLPHQVRPDRVPRTPRAAAAQHPIPQLVQRDAPVRQTRKAPAVQGQRLWTGDQQCEAFPGGIQRRRWMADGAGPVRLMHGSHVGGLLHEAEETTPQGIRTAYKKLTMNRQGYCPGGMFPC